MALLLGGRGRPGRLVRPARRPLAHAAARGPGARARASAGALPRRPRAGADRRAGALGCALRPRLGVRGLRGHRPVPEPRADVGLRRLLARPPGAHRRLRVRLARPLALARARGRVRVAPRARRERGAASRRVPGPAGAVAGRGRAARLRRHGARLLRSRKPPRAGVRDRALHVRCALRDGGLRPRHVGGARRGLRRHVPLPLAHRPAARRGRPDPTALAADRSRRRRARRPGPWRSSP